MPATTTGEFLGTLLLVLLGDGVVANVLLDGSKGKDAGWLAITAGWAFAVLAGVEVATALGAPGELNPAVTLANVLLGTRTGGDAIAHVAAQLAGAVVGATLVWLAYLPHWRLTHDAARIRGVFCTAPAVRSPAANVATEAIATAVLVIVAGALGTRGVAGPTPATNLGPALVGALVWGLGLSLGGPTGYALNPARDLGPRLAHALLPIANKSHSDWPYAWVPIVGPCLGAILAAIVWGAVRPA